VRPLHVQVVLHLLLIAARESVVVHELANRRQLPEVLHLAVPASGRRGAPTAELVERVDLPLRRLEVARGGGELVEQVDDPVDGVVLQLAAPPPRLHVLRGLRVVPDDALVFHGLHGDRRVVHVRAVDVHVGWEHVLWQRLCVRRLPLQRLLCLLVLVHCFGVVLQVRV